MATPTLTRREVAGVEHHDVRDRVHGYGTVVTLAAAAILLLAALP
jgi:hypothetical protein